jgi:hypothetical protein
VTCYGGGLWARLDRWNEDGPYIDELGISEEVEEAKTKSWSEDVKVPIFWRSRTLLNQQQAPPITLNHFCLDFY